MKRPSKDQYYLAIAYAVSARSSCLRRHYGCVIVNNDEIIAAGYNGAPRGEEDCYERDECYKSAHPEPFDPGAAVHGSKYGSCVAVHAEQNAIISAPREKLIGATLYLVSRPGPLSEALDPDPDPRPCNICDRMIRNAGIARVITESGVIYEI